MFRDLHFRRVDDAGEDFGFRPDEYLRQDGADALGPAGFQWSRRQLGDLSALLLGSDASGARQRIARDLFRFLEDVDWAPDDAQLDAAEERGQELVFTVRSDAPELFTLPWSLAWTGPDGGAAVHPPAVNLRHAAIDVAVAPPLSAPAHPGVLFAWSDAGGPVPHDAVRDLAQAGCDVGKARLVEVAGGDPAAIAAALEATPCSVLHLLCHGVAPAGADQPAALLWGDADGARLTGADLADLLAPFRDQVRLVVLTCCGDPDGGADALQLGGVTWPLHRAGIASVVASRAVLSATGVVTLAKGLYDKLMHQGWSLERAVRSARLDLMAAGSDSPRNTADAASVLLYSPVQQQASGGPRPLLATYPFGTANQPAPGVTAPRQSITLDGAVAPGDNDALRATLSELAEDPALALFDEGPQGAAPVSDARRAEAQAQVKVLTAAREEAERAVEQRRARETQATAAVEKLATARLAAERAVAARGSKEQQALQRVEKLEAARVAAELSLQERMERQQAASSAAEQAELDAQVHEARRAVEERAAYERKMRDIAERLGVARAKAEQEQQARTEKEQQVQAQAEKITAARAQAEAALEQRARREEQALAALAAMTPGTSGAGGAAESDPGPVRAWTTVDGAQRLFLAHADGRLAEGLGFEVTGLRVSTPFLPAPASAAPEGFVAPAPSRVAAPSLTAPPMLAPSPMLAAATADPPTAEQPTEEAARLAPDDQDVSPSPVIAVAAAGAATAEQAPPEETTSQANTPPSVQPKKKRGLVAKLAMGCAAFVVLGGLATVVVVGVGAAWVYRQLGAFPTDMSELSWPTDEAGFATADAQAEDTGVAPLDALEAVAVDQPAVPADAALPMPDSLFGDWAMSTAGRPIGNVQLSQGGACRNLTVKTETCAWTAPGDPAAPAFTLQDSQGRAVTMALSADGDVMSGATSDGVAVQATRGANADWSAWTCSAMVAGQASHTVTVAESAQAAATSLCEQAVGSGWAVDGVDSCVSSQVTPCKKGAAPSGSTLVSWPPAPEQADPSTDAAATDATAAPAAATAKAEPAKQPSTTQSSSTAAKQEPAKQAPAKPAPAKPTPVKQAPIKPAPVKAQPVPQPTAEPEEAPPAEAAPAAATATPTSFNCTYKDTFGVAQSTTVTASSASEAKGGACQYAVGKGHAPTMGACMGEAGVSCK